MYIYICIHITNAIALLFLFLHLHFFPDMFFIFSHKFAKKNAATPFFFEFWKVFVYVLTFSFIFAETCCKKKGGYIFWSMIDVFGPYISECFLHVSSQMLQNNVATPFFPSFLFFLFCPFIVSISAETCCKKKTRLHFCGVKCEKLSGILCFRASMINSSKITGNRNFFYHITWVSRAFWIQPHIYMYTHIHIYISTYLHIDISTDIHIYISAYLHIYIYTCTHICIYTYIHIYTYRHIDI